MVGAMLAFAGWGSGECEVRDVMYRWVDLHEQAEKEGHPPGPPPNFPEPSLDSLPGIRLLPDEYTMRRLAKVSPLLPFCFFGRCRQRATVSSELSCIKP